MGAADPSGGHGLVGMRERAALYGGRVEAALHRTRLPGAGGAAGRGARVTAGLRVVVVDDQELVRSGFALILERAGMEVVGQAGDGAAAIEAVRAAAPAALPDVVLMDIRMPVLDGIEATRRLVAEHPELRVLALTTFDLDEYVYAAVRAGASGFLLKDVSPDDLVHAVRGGRARATRCWRRR